MNPFKSFAIVALLGAVLGGCSSTPIAPPPVQPTAATVPMPTADRSVASTPTTSSTVATVTLPSYLDPDSPISRERSVFFDFDDSTVKSEYAGLIQLQGNYLGSKPSLSIRIEGNTDERGSPEYNLALGQRRADAVLKALEIYGVKGKQLEAISWGEEHPKATAHDEAAWAQNRRADLVYPPR